MSENAATSDGDVGASRSTHRPKKSRSGTNVSLPDAELSRSGTLTRSESLRDVAASESHHVHQHAIPNVRSVTISETNLPDGSSPRSTKQRSATRVRSAHASALGGDDAGDRDTAKLTSARSAVVSGVSAFPESPGHVQSRVKPSSRPLKSLENADIGFPLVVRMKPLMHENDQVYAAQGANKNAVNLSEKGKPPQVFQVDQCLDSTATQEAVFECIGRALLRHTVSGFDTTVFAHGSPGTGKTHTMLGSGAYDAEGCTAGLIARFTNAIFAHIEEKKSQGWEVTCTVSFALAYATLIKHLLEPDESDSRPLAEKHRQQQQPLLGPEDAEAHLETQTPVTSAAEVHALLKQGAEERMPDSRTFSVRNSLSHAIFTCRLSMIKLGVGVSRAYHTTAHFVDLASTMGDDGSVSSTRSAHTMTAKSGLKVLKEALRALSSEKNKRQPSISNNALLRHLQLSPSTKIYMIATIDPSAPPASSAQTLRYAAQCCGLALDDPDSGPPRATVPVTLELSDNSEDEDGDSDDPAKKNSALLKPEIESLEALLRAANIDPQWSAPGALVPAYTFKFDGAAPPRSRALTRKLPSGSPLTASGCVRTQVSRTDKVTAVELLPQKSGTSPSPRRAAPSSSSPYFLRVPPFSQKAIDTAIMLFHIEENVPAICGSHVEADVHIPGGIPFACALTFERGGQNVRVTTKMPNVWDDVLCNREYIVTTWRQTRKRKLGVRILRGGKKQKSVLVESEEVGQGPARNRIVSAEVEHNDVLVLSKSLHYRLVVPDIASARKQEEKEKKELAISGRKSKRAAEVHVDTVDVPDEGLKQRADKEDPLETVRARILTHCSTKSMVDSTKRFIDDITNRLSPVNARALFVRLGRLLPLVHEANQLTSVIRPRSRLRFSIGSIENWADKYEAKPIIAVRLLKNEYYGIVRWRHIVHTKVMNKVVNPLETFDSVVAVYEIWEFCRRLYFMRAVNELAMTSGLHVATAFLAKNSQVNDPWLNFTGQDTEESAMAQQERDRMREMDSIEYSSLSEQYRLLQNSLKELQRENSAREKQLAVKKKDIGNLRRKLSEQITKSEDVAKQDPKVKNYQELTAKMGQLGGKLQQAADARYDAEARLQQEKTKWENDIRTGAVMTEEQHEERKKHAIHAAINAKKGKGFMTVEEHSQALAKEEELVSKWMETHEALRLAIETDYITREEHEKAIQQAKEEGNKWRARAIAAAGSSNAAAKRQLDGLIAERTQRKQHPS